MNTTISGFPKLPNDVQTYLEHIDTINAAEARYNAYLDSFKSWLCEQVRFINPKLIPHNVCRTYWQFSENKKWKKLDFHFELTWKSNKELIYLTEKDEVNLVIHLEKSNQNAKDYFGKSGTLHTAKVIVNFSDEENSIKSLNTIISMTQSQEFQKYAEKANGYIKEHLNEHSEIK
ncbi:MAG: hypothetical protein LBM98_09380 [Oscillospiraceae bacterium]|jgi:hypothetical protein|nr:hypothetical protein [Oscillospiraceae bacterium]